MGDFYSIVAHAVSALESNTREARCSLYERARAALDTEMRGSDDESQSEFLIALISLAEAIAKVERDAQRGAQSEEPAIARRSTFVSSGRSVAKQVRNSRQATAKWTHPFARFWMRASQRDDANGQALIDDFAAEMEEPHGRDNWLSDLLTRASQEEDGIANDQSFEPRRKSAGND
jgi:hypothetical protein